VALQEALLRRAGEEGLSAVGGDTQLMIAPGYRFAMADALLTNFHQASRVA
jgi:S-adenosylmethionine:tRNA-ribosyltransferase-isomerase (queuine synthetase)